MTVYDFNKNGYRSLPDLDEAGKKRGLEIILSYLNTTKNKFYMILNHDIHYYTLYNGITSTKALAADILDLMEHIGRLKAIELSKNGQMVEFWIIDITGECHMYSLFAYDKGVITV